MGLTAGDLSAAHLGSVLTLTPPGEEPVTGELYRVQHNTAAVDFYGNTVPPQALVVIGPWSGPLDPTHPVQEA